MRLFHRTHLFSRATCHDWPPYEAKNYRELFPHLDPWVYGILARVERQGFTLSTVLSARHDRVVWHAKNQRGHDVVIRLMDADEDEHQRLSHRCETLTRLRHPHCEVIRQEIPLSPTHWAVVSDYIPGVRLHTLLHTRGVLMLGELSTVIDHVASALGALHRADLVHGDVSPHNIIITPDGEACLIDLLSTSGDCGTDGFMSPQRQQGHAPTWQDDVYSLACVIRAASDPHDWAYDKVRWGDALSDHPMDRPTAMACSLRTIPGIPGLPVSVPEPTLMASDMIRSQIAAPTRHRDQGLAVRKTHNTTRRVWSQPRLALMSALAVLSIVIGGAGAAIGTHHSQVVAPVPPHTGQDIHQASATLTVYHGHNSSRGITADLDHRNEDFLHTFFTARDAALRQTGQWEDVFKHECPMSPVAQHDEHLRDWWKDRQAIGLNTQIHVIDTAQRQDGGRLSMRVLISHDEYTITEGPVPRELQSSVPSFPETIPAVSDQESLVALEETSDGSLCLWDLTWAQESKN